MSLYIEFLSFFSEAKKFLVIRVFVFFLSPIERDKSPIERDTSLIERDTSLIERDTNFSCPV